MRRLFIIRKDLKLSAGKLAAMIGHCSEAYWTNLLKQNTRKIVTNSLPCVNASSHISGERSMQMYKRQDLCEISAKAFNEGKDYALIKQGPDGRYVETDKEEYVYHVDFDMDIDIYENYIMGIFTKTICEAKNLNHLLKVVDLAKELGLVENVDFGLINDKCLTELTPENEDGTCTVGVWFKPLDDEISHKLSKKYQLYK